MVKIENLSKSYGKVKALKDVSFQAQDGQIFGLLGPNGAGKTTLLRTLATLLKPTQGTATVAGFDIRKDPEQVRKNIGVVNGGMGLYDRLTGREILHYFGGFYDLKRPQIEKRIAELDGFLDLREVLDRRAGEFSTGMKQKIVVARAVIHDPKVLILDEATNGLDVVARRALLDFVKSYRTGEKLVLYSTHVMEEVEELCENLAVIDHGSLLFNGSLQDLKLRTRKPRLEEAFFELARGVSHAF
ncbi:ABC transporter ATP-binding protein [Deinococcus roseus]|uniref:ABC transporter ATP-binding protein n=1 Tax=Deinococcus roseus TaxID=392414 RepID=A0ABQ2CW53_9DEIO|nr:ATP-binding cassette domain-containing protein [Deinococcus roseus]GGJ19838.1 ABC transporter ATP-binding protein [Deinococcus roseus]